MVSDQYRVNGHLYAPEDSNDRLSATSMLRLKKVKTGKEYRYVLTQLGVKH